MNLGSTIEGTESFKVGRKTNNMYIIRLTTLLGNLSSDTLGTYEELCRMLLRVNPQGLGVGVGNLSTNSLPLMVEWCLWGYCTSELCQHVWLIAYHDTSEHSEAKKWGGTAELALGAALTVCCTETRWTKGMWYFYINFGIYENQEEGQTIDSYNMAES